MVTRDAGYLEMAWPKPRPVSSEYFSSCVCGNHLNISKHNGAVNLADHRWS